MPVKCGGSKTLMWMADQSLVLGHKCLRKWISIGVTIVDIYPPIRICPRTGKPARHLQHMQN